MCENNKYNKQFSDGEISKKELKKVLNCMNGLIASENIDQATDDMIATTTLAEADDDGDGKISLDEYIKACMEREEFTKMLTLKIIDIFVENEEEEKPEEEN